MKKIVTFLLLLVSLGAFSQSTTLVISQFYGAGGNTGATLNADYVELHNISGGAISLNGMTIQYSSATNNGIWSGVSPLPSVSVPAGGYYLIQMSSVGTVGAALPAPDYISSPTIALSATSGKLALVNSLTALTGCPFPSATVIDGVGYGSANCFETAATPVLTPTTGGIRNNNGCTETDNNSTDFTITAPAPRNSSSPVFICSGVTPVATLSAGTVIDFGNVVVGTNSASQTFNLSGTNLTGAPGTITITSPSGDFQVSDNNVTWSNSTSVIYNSATLTATPVYVRFTPQTAGPKTGNVTITGGGASTVTVAVSGNGIAGAVASVTSSSLASFGPVCINSTAGPNSFIITGTNLTTADLVVGPLAGFTFSLTASGGYAATLVLVHPAGNYMQTIFVQFTPTTATSYNGNIPVTGGGLASPATVVAAGSGSDGIASVVTGGATAVTQASATLAATVSSGGCSLLTAYGFQYSLVSGFTTGTIAASNNLTGLIFSADLSGLLPATTYYYKAFATNAGGTGYGTEMSFTTATPPPASLSASAINEFGSTCVGTTQGPNNFDITGTNLSVANITVGPLNGYTFSTTAAGTYSASLTLVQTGGSYLQTIYVKFTPPSIGSFSGNIPVTGGGVSSFTVPVSGAGTNSAALPVTGEASSITANSAVIGGSFTNSGCSDVFSAGIEYSGINGFINGSGFKVASVNLAGTDFSANLTGLVPGTTYYYKTYAENNGGASYGIQNSFTTLALPDGLVIYSTPIIHGQNLHYSLQGLKTGHYSARIHNSIGQLVFQKEIIIQVNFIDDNFILPANLPIGLYNLEIRNYEYKIQKSFMVQ